MRKPIIGLVPLVDYKRKSYWMLPGYMKAVEDAGGIPVMMPLTSDITAIEQLSETMDGFILTGGQDVAPDLYGVDASSAIGEMSPARDMMEHILFDAIRAQNKPVFGICRGLQLMNVLLGGTLYQDLPTEHPSDVSHRQMPPYENPSHDVSVEKDTPLFKLLKEERIAVNSCHHQAIKELAPSLKPMAYAQDGLVEAAYLQEARFLMGVQWHPEFMYENDQNSKALFLALIQSCV